MRSRLWRQRLIWGAVPFMALNISGLARDRSTITCPTYVRTSFLHHLASLFQTLKGTMVQQSPCFITKRPSPYGSSFLMRSALWRETNCGGWVSINMRPGARVLYVGSQNGTFRCALASLVIDASAHTKWCSLARTKSIGHEQQRSARKDIIPIYIRF